MVTIPAKNHFFRHVVYFSKNLEMCPRRTSPPVLPHQWTGRLGWTRPRLIHGPGRALSRSNGCFCEDTNPNFYCHPTSQTSSSSTRYANLVLLLEVRLDLPLAGTLYCSSWLPDLQNHPEDLGHFLNPWYGFVSLMCSTCM